MNWILFAAMVAIAGAEPNQPTNGFFLALEDPDLHGGGADRIYRIDWDGTLTPIGGEGALGYPEVSRLVWDWESERLFAFDQLLHVWLEIDPQTSVATPLASYDLNPIDLTYNSNDGLIYAKAASTIHSIDPDTAEVSVVAESVIGQGIAHAVNATGGLDGLFTAAGGLDLWVEPDFHLIELGGNLAASESLMWNPTNGELYNFRGQSLDDLFIVNTVTGNQELLADWDFGNMAIRSVTFVPQLPLLPNCVLMDTDYDTDIDLKDFAVWQNCFSGPRNENNFAGIAYND